MILFYIQTNDKTCGNPNGLTIISATDLEPNQPKCNRNSGFIEIVKAEDDHRPNNAVDILARYIFFSSFTLFIMSYVIYICI